MSEVFIALFRGINVGGNKVAKMETLRKALTAAGFGDVATYIQSGNVVLTSDGKAVDVAARIEKVFEATFGFSSRVTLRSLAEWQRLVDENPFPQGAENHKALHAVLLDAEPDAGAAGRLGALAAGREEFAMRDGVLYLFTPDGFGISKLAASLDKAIKVPLTARNWRTVLTLLEMAHSVAGKSDAAVQQK